MTTLRKQQHLDLEPGRFHSFRETFTEAFNE